jgi:sulfide:quinone oxidoreductase
VATPIKCAGAPQKIMYITEDYTKRNGIKPKISFIIPQPSAFGVAYARPLLEKIMNERGISQHYGEDLIEVKGEERIAIFRKVYGHSFSSPISHLTLHL